MQLAIAVGVVLFRGAGVGGRVITTARLRGVSDESFVSGWSPFLCEGRCIREAAVMERGGEDILCRFFFYRGNERWFIYL